MRNSTRLTSVLLAIGVVVAVGGCSTVQQAADAVGSGAAAVTGAISTAEVCAKALESVGTTPDLTAPQTALDTVHAQANELTGLAASLTDTTISQAVTALATTLSRTTLADLTTTPATWLQARADEVSALTTACTP
ncbi:bacteriophage spanin2 family protein [Lentzea sp. HUAS12]|uniref:bacteriophage spanin2 family protein n=1 Tax=Lentzea sp. HUAS12 TaxID=2951806 RepID=UPI00209CF151|nr:bacteriophage spanin2 family protein [Lentzea sp. HUAS12]USX54400.1 bacteriophage spanin2 family protein [Lentzea sp. HUAS12]